VSTSQGTALERGPNRAGAVGTRIDGGDFAQPTHPRGA
jgi:hypothetical protein